MANYVFGNMLPTDQMRKDYYDSEFSHLVREWVRFKAIKKTVELGTEYLAGPIGIIGSILADFMDIWGAPLNTTEAAAEQELIDWMNMRNSQGAFKTGRVAMQYRDP